MLGVKNCKIKRQLKKEGNLRPAGPKDGRRPEKTPTAPRNLWDKKFKEMEGNDARVIEEKCTKDFLSIKKSAQN